MEKHTASSAYMHSMVQRQNTLSVPAGVADAQWEVNKTHFIAVFYHKQLTLAR